MSYLPGLIPFMVAAGGVGDPYANDSYTKILLHLIGVNGSVIHVDDSPSNRGLATVATSAAVSGIQSHFSTQALLLNGSNQYLQFADHADFDVG